MVSLCVIISSYVIITVLNSSYIHMYFIPVMRYFAEIIKSEWTKKVSNNNLGTVLRMIFIDYTFQG